MPCYNPLSVWYEKGLSEKGKRRLTFKRPDSLTGKRHELPCGRCVGCRLERSRQWAVRCMHEKQMHMYSAFVTLTYEDAALPYGGSLRKRDLQLFMKRLRKAYGEGVRFYACGEYGEQNRRPHYHLLLFNMRFEDAKPIATAKGGQQLYRSEILRKLWPVGHNFIGEVTFDSCAYVARYILKKVTGEGAVSHYQVVSPYGEIIDLEPEFTVMSRRPGIGATWFEKYHKGVYDWDSVVMNGVEAKPPRFYDDRMEALDSDKMDFVRLNRRRKAKLYSVDDTVDRRFVKECVTLRRMALFARREM